MEEQTKFCKHCGEKIPTDAVICTKCGRQVEEIKKVGVNRLLLIIRQVHQHQHHLQRQQ